MAAMLSQPQCVKRLIIKIQPRNYAHGLDFAVFCRTLEMANFTHIIQGYSTGIETKQHKT